MVSITIILFYIVLLTFIILGIMLLYNLFLILYWKWKNKYDKTNTNYERKKILHHRKLIFLTTPIMIAMTLFIFLYYISISFETLVGNNNISQAIKYIIILRSNKELDIDNKISEKKDIDDVVNILKGYKYKKNIQESRFGNTGKEIGGEIITLDIFANGNYKVLDISSEGNIYDADTGQTYKIISDNKKELYDRLAEAISRVNSWNVNN